MSTPKLPVVQVRFDFLKRVKVRLEPQILRIASEGAMKIGSLAGANDLWIEDDLSMSRLHAVIENVDGNLRVIDLNSRWGTHVNGVKIGLKPHPLKTGDEVMFGHTVVRVTFPYIEFEYLPPAKD